MSFASSPRRPHAGHPLAPRSPNDASAGAGRANRLAASALAALTLAAVLLGGCVDAAPIAGPARYAGPTLRTDLPPAGARGMTVLTRNLAVGADLTPFASAPAAQVPFLAAQTWATVQASNFPARAQALAREIAETRPHLVGLQEVEIVRTQLPGDAAFGGTIPAATVIYDFLALLLDELAARGLGYVPVAVQQNFESELPAFVSFDPLTFLDVRLTDRDVILARADVPVANSAGANFTAALPVSVAGTTLLFLRGWTSVEATVGGMTFRFVNTHLEAEGDAFQAAQAAELLAVLADEPLPVVLVGDFNSAADGSGTPTYELIASAGYTDAWSESHARAAGYTCCQAADLRNAVSTLSERIDIIFVRDGFASGSVGILGGVHVDVLGEMPGDRTASGLWPSDHAGVVATLHLPAAVATAHP